MSEAIQESVRFKLLLQIIQKAMTRTRAQLDLGQIAKDCYGDDLAIFGNNDDDNALEKLLESMLDRVDEQVLEGMKDWLEKKKVEELLLSVERDIHRQEQEELRKAQAEQDDKESAHRALKDATLPKGITPEDLVNLRAYEKMTSERDAMLQEIQQMETETAEFEAQRAKKSALVDQCLSKAKKLGKELEQSADICSMVS